MKMNFIRRAFCMLLLIISGPLCLQAQVPQAMNYQGIARDAKGNPLSLHTMSLKLSILPAADATQAEYEEIQTVTTNEFGLYTLQIGSGQAKIGEVKTVKWETGNKYIRVAIDPNGGSDFTDAGTTQLLSVPYALYADRAGSAKGGSDRTGTVSSNAAHVAGDANFLTKFTALNVIGKSLIFDNGTSVGIGTTAPNSGFTFHVRRTTNGGHILMENPNANSFGTFRMINDVASNFATFTKYGSTFPGGYTGISTLYPFANTLGYGNNGPFLNAGTGNIGFAITKAGTNKLKIHIDAAAERIGFGGNAVPQTPVHFNNTASGNDTLKFTNQTTGHTLADGTELRLNGNDTRLINRENGSLSFGTNNSERMSITPNGNVGIGISNPTQDALHIRRSYASIRLEDSNDNASLYIVAPDPSAFTTGGIGTSTNHELPFFTNNVERLVIKNDGKIGIGTNTPVTDLDVNGQVKISGGNPGSGKILSSDANGLASWQLPGADSQWARNGQHIFNTNPGRVGIGTSNPTSPVHLASPVSEIRLENTAINTSLFITAPFNGGTGGIGTDGNHELPFFTNNIERMVIKGDGRVGIGTNTPAARMHVADSAVVFSAVGDTAIASFNNPPPIEGPGRRMLWYPERGAFRVGGLAGSDSLNWNRDSIGAYSVAMGWNSQAKGRGSFAAGDNVTANGNGSTAIGSNTSATGSTSTAIGLFTTASGVSSSALGSSSVASGQNSLAIGLFANANGGQSIAIGSSVDALGFRSTAIGSGSTASGIASIAFGDNVEASGENATAMGKNTIASGENSTAMGSNTEASGLVATAIGANTIASGEGSTAMGISTTASQLSSTAMGNSTMASGITSTALGSSTTASGARSTAMGSSTTAAGGHSMAMGTNSKANGFSSLAIGRFNDTLVAIETSMQSTTPLFIIGNGTGNSTRSNAFVVRNDGNTEITNELQRPSKTGASNLIPICYGSVSLGAVINSGTGNFTVTTPSTGLYEITITGETYSNTAYIAQVSVVGGASFRVASTGASAGKLQIRIFDQTGALVNANFHFTVFKP